MKRKMLSRLMAASMAAIMTVGMAGCGGNGDSSEGSGNSEQTPSGENEGSEQTPSDENAGGEQEGGEEGQTTLRIDPKTDEPFDLGGMDIIIADWFTGEKKEEDMSEFELAQKEYRDWLQETYHFTMVQKNYAGWGWGEGSIGEAFVNAATQGSDDNIIYVLTNSAATASYVHQGLMYDISKLDGDVVDLSAEKYTVNGELDNWSVGDAKYCFYTDASEPRGVLYFNKDVLRDANIDPESIYEMQKNGTWTWDAWVDVMKQVQRDTDNDGQIDVYGCVQNNGGMIYQCVRSNGGALVSKDENGKYILTADDDKVREGLHFGLDTVTANYFLNYGNEEGSNWEDYKYLFMSGKAAFMYDDVYCTYAGGWLTGTQIDSSTGEPIQVNGNSLNQDVDYGFVMFPKGPQADDMVTNVDNNPVCMPSSYSDDKARLLMFAYDVWTEPLSDPQWEGYTGIIDNVYRGAKDTKCVDETMEMMATRGVPDVYKTVADFNVNEPFLYQLYLGQDVDALLDSNLAAWQTAVDNMNASLGL